MNKQQLKKIYLILNVFRQDVLKTGCPTNQDIAAFVEMYPHYSPLNAQILIRLGNAHGWPKNQYMDVIIDNYKPTVHTKNRWNQ